MLYEATKKRIYASCVVLCLMLMAHAWRKIVVGICTLFLQSRLDSPFGLMTMTNHLYLQPQSPSLGEPYGRDRGLLEEVFSQACVRHLCRGISIFPWEGNPLNPILWEGNFLRCGKTLLNGQGLLWEMLCCSHGRFPPCLKEWCGTCYPSHPLECLPTKLNTVG